MNEVLCMILCEPEHWSWEPYLNYFIKFNRDGTGELFCIQELTYLCALNLEWGSLGFTPPPASTSRRTKPQALGTLQLEVSLEKGLASGLRTQDPSNCLRLHDKYLLDSAYRKKSFSVTIEKGNFLPTSRIGREYKNFSKLRYGLRLLFNQSPFPQLDDWNTRFPNDVPPVGPADRKQPPMVEFVARDLPESERKGAAMNDIPSTFAWVLGMLGM